MNLLKQEHHRGSASVEFALCFPAIMIIGILALQVLSSIQISQELSSIARQAVTVGSDCYADTSKTLDPVCLADDIYGKIDEIRPGVTLILSIYERAGRTPPLDQIVRTQFYNPPSHDDAASKYRPEDPDLHLKLSALDGSTIKRVAVAEAFYKRAPFDFFGMFFGDYYEVAIF